MEAWLAANRGSSGTVAYVALYLLSGPRALCAFAPIGALVGYLLWSRRRLQRPQVPFVMNIAGKTELNGMDVGRLRSVAANVSHRTVLVVTERAQTVLTLASAEDAIALHAALDGVIARVKVAHSTDRDPT